MPSTVVAQGLETAGKVIAGLSTQTNRTMSFDDNTTGFSSAHTAVNSAGAIATFVRNATTNTTVGSQTVRYQATLTTAEFNGQTVRRIAIHFDTSANVTSASNTLFGGVDGQSFAKTSEAALSFLIDLQQRST